MEQEKVKVVRQPDTKNKIKYLGGALGISISVYIDKMHPDPPKKLVLELEED